MTETGTAGIVDRIRDFANRRRVWDRWRESVAVRLSDNRVRLGEVSSGAADLRDAVLVLGRLAEEIQRTDESLVVEVCTEALRETFPDQELSLAVEHTQERGGQVGVTFRLRDEVLDVEDDPLEAFGGGPTAVLSLMLQVISIVRHPGMARVLILDEPLVQVSGYQELAGQKLRSICENLGFQALVVTQLPGIAEASHTQYEACRNEGGSLCLRKIEK